MFGDWRSPVWIPVNTLLIRGLLEMYPFYGDDFKVESDHGDMLGDQNLWRKTYAYEQSSRIPMLLRPARSQSLNVARRVASQPVEIRDLLPTFLDAASAPIPHPSKGKASSTCCELTARSGAKNSRERASCCMRGPSRQTTASVIAERFGCAEIARARSETMRPSAPSATFAMVSAWPGERSPAGEVAVFFMRPDLLRGTP